MKRGTVSEELVGRLYQAEAAGQEAKEMYIEPIKVSYKDIGNGRAKLVSILRFHNVLKMHKEEYEEIERRTKEAVFDYYRKEMEELYGPFPGAPKPFEPLKLVLPLDADMASAIYNIVWSCISEYSKFYAQVKKKVESEHIVRLTTRNIRGYFAGRRFDPETLEFDLEKTKAESYYDRVKKRFDDYRRKNEEKLRRTCERNQRKPNANMPVDNLEISVMPYNTVHNEEIRTLAELASYPVELFGNGKIKDEISEALESFGFRPLHEKPGRAKKRAR